MFLGEALTLDASVGKNGTISEKGSFDKPMENKGNFCDFFNLKTKTDSFLSL